jgi:paraquat-inducible protein B
MGPVLLGGAVIFAGKSIGDERKRLLGQRRQEARTAVRQYVDDVQFEVAKRLREMVRELQREIRDDIAGRLEELQRTLSETTAALERAARQGAEARAARIRRLEEELRALADLDHALTAAESLSRQSIQDQRGPDPAASPG